MTPSPLEPVLFEVKRTIVGQDVLLERMAIAMLAGGHLLVEGVPGLAKTLAVKSLAGAIGLCQPTSSERGSTTIGPASSRDRLGRCSPTCYSRTRSIAPRQRCRARYWR